MLQGGSGKNYQDNPQDKTLIPTRIDEILTNSIIKTDNEYFVFYGGIFIPVTSYTDDYSTCVAELNRFHSNCESSINTSVINNYSCNLTYDLDAQKWDYTSVVTT